ncbi:MAG: hypothetical protein RSI06_09655 [Lachnospiraceae bacterium]
MLSITEKIHRLFVSICFTIAPAAAFLIYIPEIRNASIQLWVIPIMCTMMAVGGYWVRKKQVLSNKYMEYIVVIY